MKKLFIILSFLFVRNLYSTEVLPLVTLQGEYGGRLDGSSWSSSEINGKVFTLFYVDPDEKNLNEPLADLLKKENFPLDKYGSIGIINMAATWLPNFAIASSLKEKQKKFPNTVYVKDLKKVLVKEWNLKDDSSNVLIFDKSGKLLIKVMGKATDEEAQKVLSLIKDNL